MPELPEVETTRLGLLPAVCGQRIEHVIVRESRLRWPVPEDFALKLSGMTIDNLSRRGKYLLWHCHERRRDGILLSHLGMSGALSCTNPLTAPGKHDHIDIVLHNGTAIRYTDPRRFGAMLWIDGKAAQHPLLDKLGLEPLSEAFSGTYLYAQSRTRRVSVKEFIMNGQVVVGVGNIYASESLHLAGINPTLPVGRLSRARCQRLCDAIRTTLQAALNAGGSTLRNYVNADGAPGWFQLSAQVYDRAGEACRRCEGTVRMVTQGQRSTFFCPRCQR